MINLDIRVYDYETIRKMDFCSIDQIELIRSKALLENEIYMVRVDPNGKECDHIFWKSLFNAYVCRFIFIIIYFKNNRTTTSGKY